LRVSLRRNKTPQLYEKKLFRCFLFLDKNYTGYEKMRFASKIYGRVFIDSQRRSSIGFTLLHLLLELEMYRDAMIGS
jgi:hypothetical protein